jgi:selT/selW/selH-like putative selenoprotein
MATELITKFPENIGAINLHAGVGGAFEVLVDGEQVYSKLQTKRYPEMGELVAPIQAKIPAGSPA